jgi:hypothetical protein
MEENYKGHTIIASSDHLPDTQQWGPRVQVIWSEGQNDRIKQLIINERFPTKIEAEKHGLANAKRWIDDGKPS